MRRSQGVSAVPFEFPSGVRETIRHFWIEYDFGACFSLSHRRKTRRVAKERTCRARVLFRLSLFVERACRQLRKAISRARPQPARFCSSIACSRRQIGGTAASVLL